MDSTLWNHNYSKLLILVSIAFFFRLFLIIFVPQIHNVLSQRVEISTRLTSIRTMKEAIFLLKNSIPLYDIPCMPSPILVWTMSWIPMFLYGILYIIIDMITAIGFHELARYESTPKHALIVVSIYLMNPLLWLSTLAQSNTLWPHIAIVWSLVFANRGIVFLSIGLMLFASSLNLYSILLLLPLYYYIKKNANISLLYYISTCIIWTSFYTSSSFLLSNSNLSFLQSCYGCILQVKDLTPNIGLYWYMFIEIFKEFRTLFLFVFQSTIFFYTIPLGFKYAKQDPFFLIAILLAIYGMFQPYPNISDVGFYLVFIAFFKNAFRYIYSKLFITVNAFLYGLLMMPVFFYYWIYQGSGNSNFYYVGTLVVTGAQILFVWDFMRAKIISDIFAYNSELHPSEQWDIHQ